MIIHLSSNPHLPLSETFAMLGEDISNHVELMRVAPLYRCLFEEDGSSVDITTDEDIMKQSIEAVSASFMSFQSYMQVAQAFLAFGLPNVIEERLHLDSLGRFVSACISAFPLRSHASVLKQYFPTSPKARALLSFQDLYIGLSPRAAPAVFSFSYLLSSTVLDFLPL